MDLSAQKWYLSKHVIVDPRSQGWLHFTLQFHNFSTSPFQCTYYDCTHVFSILLWWWWCVHTSLLLHMTTTKTADFSRYLQQLVPNGNLATLVSWHALHNLVHIVALQQREEKTSWGQTQTVWHVKWMLADPWPGLALSHHQTRPDYKSLNYCHRIRLW